MFLKYKAGDTISKKTLEREEIKQKVIINTHMEIALIKEELQNSNKWWQIILSNTAINHTLL